MKTILCTATALAIVVGGALGSTAALAASYAPDYSQTVSPTTSEFAPAPLSTVSPDGQGMVVPQPERPVTLVPTTVGHLAVR